MKPRKILIILFAVAIIAILVMPIHIKEQTFCSSGNGPLDELAFCEKEYWQWFAYPVKLLMYAESR